MGVELRSSLIILLILLCSCSRVVVTSQRCSSNGSWTNSGNSFQFSKEYRVTNWGGGDHFVKIADLIGQDGISCDEVTDLSVMIYKDGFDILTGIIPYFDQTSILIKANYKVKK